MKQHIINAWTQAKSYVVWKWTGFGLLGKTVTVAVVALAGYIIIPKFFASSSTALPTANELYTVTPQSISEDLTVVGSTQIATSQDLTFGQGGRVTGIFVKVGQKVKKWDVLAEVDTRDAVNSITSQELSLQNAQINYNKLYTDTKPYQIQQVQQNATTAAASAALGPQQLQDLELERDQKIAQQKALINQLTGTIALNQSKLLTLSGQVTYTQQVGDQNIQQANASYASNLQQVWISSQSILSDTRDFLNTINNNLHFVSNNGTYTPNGYSAQNVTLLSSIKSQYQQATSDITLFAAAMPASAPSSIAQAEDMIAKARTIANEIITLSDAVAQGYQASVSSSSDFTQSAIDTQKAAALSTKSKFLSTLTSLNNLRTDFSSMTDPATTELNTANSIATQQQSRQDLQNTLTKNQSDLADAIATLNKLSIDYDIQIQQKKDDIASQSTSATIASLNAQDLINGPTADEKASAENSIKQAQISLDNAQKNLEDYQIIAQFDGTVDAIAFKVNDEVSAHTEAISVAVPGIYEVKISLDQLDIVKVNIGQPATITFDSYPDKVFSGTISEIDPTPTTDQGVVSYSAKVVLQQNEVPIYNDMSATAVITIQTIQDTIVVPSLDVATSGSRSTVQLFTGNKLITRFVKLGIDNGDQVQILSGLSIGDKITTRRFTVSAAAGGSSFSLFGGGATRRTGAAGWGGNFGGGAGGTTTARPAGAPTGG